MLVGDEVTVMTAVVLSQFEAKIVSDFDNRKDGVVVVRRCVDIAEVLSVAYSGLARALLISADMPGLNRQVVEQLRIAGVCPVAVIDPMASSEVQDRLSDLRLHDVVAADAGSVAIATALRTAVIEHQFPVSTAMGDAGSAYRLPPPPRGDEPFSPRSQPASGPRGTVVAVWGPAGAPGRSTVALTLTDEGSRLGVPSLLIDADVYGGAIAPMLGLLDEAPGLAAACRSASNSSLDTATLAKIAVSVGPNFRLLTGISRVDRWPELRPSAVTDVVDAARRLAPLTVIDCGFSIEQDEEISYDTAAPRRNGATIAALESADRILVVSAPDPVGVSRSIRALADLGELIPTAPSLLAINRIRSSLFTADAAGQLEGAFRRFSGRGVDLFIPDDPKGVDAAVRSACTLAEAAPSSPARDTIRELAALLTGATVPGRRRRRRRR